MIRDIRWRHRVELVVVGVLVAAACSSDPEVITVADPSSTTSTTASAASGDSGASTTTSAADTTTTQTDSGSGDGVGLAGNPVGPGVTVRVNGFEDVLDVRPGRNHVLAYNRSPFCKRGIMWL